MGQSGTDHLLSDRLIGKISHAYKLDDAKFTCINISENTTYRIDVDNGVHYVLRVYRPDHRTVGEIDAELDWMEALAVDAGVLTPAVVRTMNGARIFSPEPAARHVLFAFLPGEPPPEADLPLWFGRLGELCARIHVHGSAWRPTGFDRPSFDWDSLIGARPVWGRWQDLSGLDAPAIRVIDGAARIIAERVAALAHVPGATGLIHGDLRLANLLADGDDLAVLDFDDCGTGWLLYDLATALSLIEDTPEAPAAAAAWLDAYTGVRGIDRIERGIVPDLIMLRRIQVLGWLASHGDTELALTHGPAAAAATTNAAAAFVRGQSPFRQ